jgi:hypothetical protein
MCTPLASAKFRDERDKLLCRKGRNPETMPIGNVGMSSKVLMLRIRLISPLKTLTLNHCKQNRSSKHPFSKLIHLRFRALPAGRSIGRRLRTQPGFMSRKRTRAALVITCSVSASGGKGPQAEAATGYSGSEGYGRGGEGLNRPNAKTNAANETNKGPADGSGTATIVSTHTPGSDVTDPSPTIGPS